MDAIRTASHAVFAAVCLVLTCATGSALAANFTVNSTADAVDGSCGNPCTLRDAVIAANAVGGASTISLPTGTYNLTIPRSGSDDATTGDLNVTADVTINGALNTSTIVDGGGTSTLVTDRVFSVDPGGHLSLTNMTIQHGHPPGGNGTLSEGGGILARGPLTLSDVNVSNNFVETPNDSQHGGGDVTITDSDISGNTSAGPGGGIYSNPSANVPSLTITGTTIASNHAVLPPGLPNVIHAWGGGLGTDGSIPVTLTKDTIAGNKADQTGGGIFDNGSSAYTISDTSIIGNAAVAGFSSGGISIGGGGIFADGGSATPGWNLRRDLIANNTAGDGTHPNVAGGGIEEDGGNVFTITNTTISNNTATGEGGGYQSNGGGTHTLTNVTLDLNRAGTGAGNIDNSGGARFTLANTIVSRGTPVNCATSNGSNLPSTLGHNLETANTCGLGATGDQTNADPKLAALNLNGGPTFTEEIQSGSPAIDAGDNQLCQSTDQRGVSRPQGPACDIGAYERIQSPIIVTNADDSGTGSLREAIALSVSGNTIDFTPSLTGQSIILTSGALVIPHSLTISGLGANNLTVKGNNLDTVFDIEDNVHGDSVTIAGVTITGGGSSGSGTAGGGGIFSNGSSSLTLAGVTVTQNQASVSAPFAGGGGGVYVNGAAVTVTGSTITNNTATLTGTSGGANGGGGIYSDGGTVTVIGSVVSDNAVHDNTTSSRGSDGGGGIYSDGGDVVVAASTVDDNSFSSGFSDNSSGGGGIYSSGGNISLSGTTVNGNAFTLSGSNRGNDGGGGVYSEGGDVTASASSIDANRATVTDSSSVGDDGGGGVFSQGGAINVSASSISLNTASITATGGSDGGGAMFDEGIRSLYTNSTLSGNSITITSQASNNGGGAIFTFGGAMAGSVTIAGNRSNVAAGALFSTGSFRLENTIVAGNSGSPAGDCAGTGPFSSAGFNLESGTGCGLAAPGDLTNTDPKLGPLQNNGGPTLTQALLPGSPAIDAGSCLGIGGAPIVVDQRGVSRPQPAGGQCDIGAFELQQSGGSSPPPPLAPAAVPGAPVATGSTGVSFSASVNPNGQATTVVFQYGIDSRYRPGGGSAVIYDQSTPPQALPADSTVHAVSAAASGLVPNALYHVRLLATNATGTTFGPDQTFTTPAAAPPPPPVLGQSVNVKPISGQVFVLIGTKLVPLTQAKQIPSGAILDTRTGSLQLTAALSKGKKPETGVFGGAIFKLTQAHNGLTNLSLAEGALEGAPSYATCKAHKAGEASAATTKTLQLLHATARGKFRTTGRYGAATVRGTTWTIADRCDGTLTHDITHSVAVTDFARHKTIVLHAGQSYLARAPKRR